MPLITLDTSQLTFPVVAVFRDGGGDAYGAGHRDGDTAWKAFVDGAAEPPPEVPLPAGTGYGLRLGDGTTAALSFDVREDGTLDFAPEYDAFLEGRGGRRLTVRGVRVTVDARALDHALTPALPGAAPLSSERVHEVLLLPSATYRLLVEAGTAEGGLGFSVAPDGRVGLALEAAEAGVAEATGNTLTIQGRTVTVDGRSLSHGLLPVGVSDAGSGSFLSPGTVHRLTLLPAAGYAFHAAPGLAADFSYTVHADGTVGYDGSCDRFLTGRGTRTLVVGGFAVALGAADADSDLLGIAALDGTARGPRQLTAVLTPARDYQPRTAHGVCSGFRVTRDGTLVVAPAGVRSYSSRRKDSPAAAASTPVDGFTDLTVRIAPTVPGGPPPRGTVTFTADGVSLGTVPLDELGLATLRTPVPPKGDRVIVVAYGGDDTHGTSTTTLHVRAGTRGP
ncbi:Ig-like domain-containing protein [Streptomyces sp. NPDC017254]|uniref:Ig-like domain-containing protein n=1 Tax=unclassified Streptomyces TaxID=2593676 RepID=UPI0037B191F9